MTRQTIAVLGLGVFGRTIARELTLLDQDVIVADHDERHINAVADQVSKAAIGDITDLNFLKTLGIDQCDTAIVATGTPGGICTIESSESRPPKAEPLTGTPITGRVVMAAAMPGRCAAPPAPAMITSTPRSRAVLIHSRKKSGVLWALMTFFS